MKSHHPAVRALLRANPDGLTVKQLKQALPELAKHKTAIQALKGMPDTYVDRWVDARRGQWQAVWCVVVPPEDCPRPGGRNARK